jgi:copper transport protein
MPVLGNPTDADLATSPGAPGSWRLPETDVERALPGSEADQVCHMSWPRRRRSRLSLAVTATALGLLGVVLSAAPASAHASLESTTPQQGSQVSTAPSSVSLTFSEGVGLNPQSVEVMDPKGHRVDKGDPHNPGGRSSTVTVDLRTGLPHASYSVVWHVVSADSHPIAGTFSFGVGVAAGTVAAETGSSALVGGLDGLLRGIAYAGAVLLLGATAFLAWLWPGGMVLSRPRRLVRAGWLVSVVAAAGLFLFQGPYGAGLGLGDLADPGLAGDTLATQYGKLMLLRLVVLALAVPALQRLAAARGDEVRASGWAAAGLGAVFLATFSLSEHAGQGDLVAVWATLDALHLAAASAWVGGLAVLTFAMLTRSSAADLGAVLPRWSRLAVVAVATVVITGTAQAWHQTGSLSALTGTAYGLLVLGKVAGLLAMLVLAEMGRRWVIRSAAWVKSPVVQPPAAHLVADSRLTLAGAHTAGTVAATGTRVRPVEPSIGRLRASVTAEVAIAAVVLTLTAVLVNTVPANQAFAPPYSATVVGQGSNGEAITVRLDVDRTKAGLTAVHISTHTPTGAVLPFAAVAGSLTERSTGLGPVNFSFTKAGPGRGTASAVVVPAPGTWTLTAQIRTDESTDYSATISYTVRSP